MCCIQTHSLSCSLSIELSNIKQVWTMKLVLITIIIGNKLCQTSRQMALLLVFDPLIWPFFWLHLREKNIAIGGVIIVNGANLYNSNQRQKSDYDEFSCPRRCSEIYNPLCGINKVGDTKVFVNDCYMSMENCNQLKHQSKPTNNLLIQIRKILDLCFNVIFQYIVQLMNQIVQTLRTGSVTILYEEDLMFEFIIK